MAIVPCRECKKDVSTDARHCPHCGAPDPSLPAARGTGFEWKSKTTVYGFPLVHVAFGRDARGRLRVAKGVIAVGQFGIGLVTVAQFGLGLLFGFGQFIAGFTAVAQVAVTLAVGIGQFATGYVAVGQFVMSYYGLAQVGAARHLWSTTHKDPEAVAFFSEWLDKIGIGAKALRNR